jgi:cobalt/nickel transport system permease protein
MHMSDALLSPSVGATFWAGTLGILAYCSKKLRGNIDERLVPLMGVIGAFIFAAQMINITVPGTGSSGHLGGGMILAILLGPYAAFIVMASVLTIQAFFFADGGILALGCNIWNLGVYPCFIVYPLIYRPFIRDSNNPKRIIATSILGGVVGLQLGAFSVVLQTLLSGRSELSFGPFAALMLPIHLAIGLVEGVITAGVINYVRAAKPEIIESVASTRPLGPGVSIRNVMMVFLIIAVITGGFLSWFSSTNPDGLEWAIEKIYGKTELPGQRHGIAHVLKEIQRKTAFFPDYTFKGADKKTDPAGVEQEGNARPVGASKTSMAGIIGSLMVLALVLIVSIGIKAMRKKSQKSSP